MSPTRRFFRCPECLSVWATDTKEDDMPAAGCPYACGYADAPEDLGRVNAAGRLHHHTGQRPPCDSACVYAQGPNCVCSCLGANHGGGRLALIDTFADHGTPRMRFLCAPKSAPQAVARATEWRAMVRMVGRAMDRTAPELAALLQARRAGWLSDSDFSRMRGLQALAHGWITARIRRTHAGRMKAALRILDALADTPAGAQ